GFLGGILVGTIPAARSCPMVELLDVRVEVYSGDPVSFDRGHVRQEVSHHGVKEIASGDNAGLASRKLGDNRKAEQTARQGAFDKELAIRGIDCLEGGR